MAFFFPPSCYLLQGQCYFWLDAAQLHQSLKHPRLLGYCAGGWDGFSCCSAYRPNPSTPPLQKILILLSALLEHNAAPVREHIKGIWMLMQLVFWLKTIFFLFFSAVSLFLDQLNQPFVHMPVIPSQTVIPGFSRISGFDFCISKCFWCVACGKRNLASTWCVSGFSRRAVLGSYHLCGDNHGIRPPNPEQYLTPLQQKEVAIRHLRTKLLESENRVHDRWDCAPKKLISG